MEYYIVRIYRRETCGVADGNFLEIHIDGIVEDYNGQREPFHDAQTLWQLLARERTAHKTGLTENKS